MHELGRIIGKQPGVFQRTLCKMEEDGILISEYKAKARFFKANKQYPLYQELKSIIFKTVGISGSIKKVLLETGDIDFAFIYGSYAKGKETHLSDIDLLLVGNPEEDKILSGLDRLEEILKREINYKLYDIDQFKNDIREREPFLLAILGEKKIMLLGDENELRKILKGKLN